MSDVIVITGGSRGIGAACARLAAQKGYQVCFSYVSNDKAANSLVEEITGAGGSARAVKGDVASKSDVAELFKQAAAMGTIKGLVNNAGIIGKTGRVEDMDEERLSRMMNVNILGSFFAAQQALAHMSTKKGGKGGAIVNLSSVAAVLGSPNFYVDYAASKGAIDSFTIGLAREVAAEGVRVNAVRPGIIDTEIHASGGEADRVAKMRDTVPMKREGSAMEVAEAILWLLSDSASYVTGTNVDVTGGR